MEVLFFIGKVLFFPVILYLLIAMFCMDVLYQTREMWNDDFRLKYKKLSFRLLVFFYSPICFTKKIVNEL